MAFYEKKWWKELIHKLYSWGASVVLIGALFKITHWPGANIMLTIGLTTEAVIFFFSGIEPPPKEVNWELVYPELAGVKDEEEIFNEGESSRSRRRVQGGGAVSTEALAKFEEMLEKAGEGGLFEKLHDGLNNFNANLEKLQDITDASLATKEFSEKVRTAAETVSTSTNELSSSIKEATTEVTNYASSYKNGSEQVQSSTNNLGNAINQTSDQLKNAFDALSYAADNFADNINKKIENLGDIDFTNLAEGNKKYNEEISQLNKNLAAVNAIFEMQLGEANLEQMVKDISESAEHAKKYSEEIQKLSRNLAALNDVYGRMLSAMNVKLD